MYSHVANWLEKMIQRVDTVYREATKDVCLMISNNTYIINEENISSDLSEEMRNTIDIHRRLLGLLDSKDRISPGWLKSKKCLPLILRYFVFMNKMIEARGASQTTPEDRQRTLKHLFGIVFD